MRCWNGGREENEKRRNVSTRVGLDDTKRERNKTKSLNQRKKRKEGRNK